MRMTGPTVYRDPKGFPNGRQEVFPWKTARGVLDINSSCRGDRSSLRVGNDLDVAGRFRRWIGA